MRNEFDKKLKEFAEIFGIAKSSKNLEELKDKYIDFEAKREEIFEWVVKTFQSDEDKSQYLTEFANY